MIDDDTSSFILQEQCVVLVGIPQNSKSNQFLIWNKVILPVPSQTQYVRPSCATGPKSEKLKSVALDLLNCSWVGPAWQTISLEWSVCPENLSIIRSQVSDVLWYIYIFLIVMIQQRSSQVWLVTMACIFHLVSTVVLNRIDHSRYDVH